MIFPKQQGREIHSGYFPFVIKLWQRTINVLECLQSGLPIVQDLSFSSLEVLFEIQPLPHRRDSVVEHGTMK